MLGGVIVVYDNGVTEDGVGPRERQVGVGHDASRVGHLGHCAGDLEVAVSLGQVPQLASQRVVSTTVAISSLLGADLTGRG